MLVSFDLDTTLEILHCSLVYSHKGDIFPKNKIFPLLLIKVQTGISRTGYKRQVYSPIYMYCMRRKDTVFFLVMPTVAPCLNACFHTDNMLVALLAFIPTDKSPNVDDQKAYRTTIIPKVKNSIQDSILGFYFSLSCAQILGSSYSLICQLKKPQ